MFTGIIKAIGTIEGVEREGSNIHFTISSGLSDDLHIDQSVAHDGVCLTVTSVEEGSHRVTAIQETLDRTALSAWAPGRRVNLELAMAAGDRLDGHFVQGHVDTTAECIARVDHDGSWELSFRYAPTPERILVDKGSICINGVSLTVVSPTRDTFSVAIIPYTFEHTNLGELTVGGLVNLEFDIIGKYVLRYAALYGKS